MNATVCAAGDTRGLTHHCLSDPVTDSTVSERPTDRVNSTTVCLTVTAIDVKNVFTFFYSRHIFLTFLTFFYFPYVFKNKKR